MTAKQRAILARTMASPFDPLFRLVDAGRNDEARDAIIGFDATGRLLFVVHIQFEDAFIRIISARKASQDERRNHEHF